MSVRKGGKEGDPRKRSALLFYVRNVGRAWASLENGEEGEAAFRKNQWQFIPTHPIVQNFFPGSLHLVG